MTGFFKKLVLLFCLQGLSIGAFSQTAMLTGKVTDEYGQGLAAAHLSVAGIEQHTLTDSAGHYQIALPFGSYVIRADFLGFSAAVTEILIDTNSLNLDFTLKEKLVNNLNEVVISGTLKEVSKLESAVPVEIYTSGFFKANPTPSVFDALQNINGVRPQLNCNICNTGDIHINGLEGPYTMVLIDGMPVVSGLSTVYGLSGIPQSLIDRVEVVKGPASTLYGSEAVGGLINIITQKTENAPLFSADIFGTDWGEVNTDLSAKISAGRKAQSLWGINYFNYQHPVDKNQDNFTDVTLQNRISVFNKWNIERPDHRQFALAGRYVYEDRWGGEMDWSRKYRGGDEVYGESIYTHRWELFGTYQLPLKERVLLQFSGNGHQQDSRYGNIAYIASQYISFGQLTWFKTLGKHDLLTGLTYRYTWYDDNTPATANGNTRAHTHLPGLFVQDEMAIHPQHKLLLGLRYDYNSAHGSILTPRLNYKWQSHNQKNILRLSVGNGYRVANVFTEDHAALTGAREVIFVSHLKPETSWNGNVNFLKKIPWRNHLLHLDATAFYTRFSNKIVADYDSDPNRIIYDNLHGYAISKGLSLNINVVMNNGFHLQAGATVMDVYSYENGRKVRQLFTERFTGTWNMGYTLKKAGLTVDYTGNLYGTMRLALLSTTDPRSEYSPWWSIQNIQCTKSIGTRAEIYGGIKNLLNWTPAKGNPFIIARANDPFDKNVQFDADGQAIVTTENPYGLTFDPSYVYGPNQGIRGFLGFRYRLPK